MSLKKLTISLTFLLYLVWNVKLYFKQNNSLLVYKRTFLFTVLSKTLDFNLIAKLKKHKKKATRWSFLLRAFLYLCNNLKYGQDNNAIPCFSIKQTLTLILSKCLNNINFSCLSSWAPATKNCYPNANCRCN